jgi:hypothetical protein
MGTRANPGPHDCYAAAEPDEPLFVLLARDPVAYHLVRIWAAVRSQDVATASVNFGMMMSDMSAARARGVVLDEVDRAVEAYTVAREMLRWRGERGQQVVQERAATMLERREAEEMSKICET